MRILHVASWFQPPLGYSEFHLPMAQKRLGHSVAILTSDRYYPFPDYAETVQPLLGLRIVGSGTREEYGLLTFRLAIAFEFRHHLWLRGFESIISQFKPDIVHVYQTFTPLTLQCALAKRKLKYGLITRSSMEKEVFFPKSYSRRVYYQLFKWLVAPILRQQVDIFTAVGSGACEIVSQVLNVPREQIEKVHLGGDSERMRFDSNARIKIRQDLSIPEDMIIVIYAGKLITNKDVHVLVEALTQTYTHRSLGLLLLGQGSREYKAQLSDLAKTVRGPVIFCPTVPNDELPRYFSAADIGVWPSESSNAAVEAALVGLPLVVSDSQSTQHYISMGNGLSFPRGDAASLARCLELLVDSPDLRGEMGKRGRDYAEQRLSWNTIASQCIESYQKILNNRPKLEI